MPRVSRSWVPGEGAHIISRFVDRRFYLVDDVDRAILLDSIARAHHRWDWRWLSYAAMSSHLHYGLLAGVSDPDPFFRSTHTRFALRYHRRESRETLGPVFADRPALHPIRRAMLPRLVAYHHRNPVEAGLVDRPSQSSWTSHRAYMRLDPAPAWLDVERGLEVLGFDDSDAGRRRFDEFVMEVDLLDFVPGSEDPREPTRRAGSEEDVDWGRLVAIARELNDIHTSDSLTSTSKRAARARRLVAVVATRDLGQTYATVARHLGVRPSSVFNMVARRGPDDLEPMLSEMRRRLACPC